MEADYKNIFAENNKDSDEDGLRDLEEKYFGTDPEIKDTDQDGYSDFEEIKNGYNPIGEGKLENKIDLKSMFGM